jgi:hypothetical protein
MSRREALFEDEDDIFLGLPKSKVFDAVFYANSDVGCYDFKSVLKTAALFSWTQSFLKASQ